MNHAMTRSIALGAILLSGGFLAGCATVPTEGGEAAMVAKEFKAPPDGSSGLYIYRASGPGTALKKDVWVDGKCIGETAPNVFFYTTVSGGEQHKISTESEFSPNDLLLDTEAGKNYFIKQYIKLGLFVGGANLKTVDDDTGKKAVAKLKLAVEGHCSR